MTKELRCPNCGVLFGMEEDGALTIKYRDLFRYIVGGYVYGPCRGCKSTVRWPTINQEGSDDDSATG